MLICKATEKNTDLDKCKYTGYGIGLDSLGEYSLPDGSVGKMLSSLELIWALLCTLIRERYFNSW